MTTKEVRSEIKKLILEKGLYNITNGDIAEIQRRTGATFRQATAALRYYTYSPQTAKYRTM